MKNSSQEYHVQNPLVVSETYTISFLYNQTQKETKHSLQTFNTNSPKFQRFGIGNLLVKIYWLLPVVDSIQA